MSDDNDVRDKAVSRRKTILTTAALGGSLSMAGVASADDSSVDERRRKEVTRRLESWVDDDGNFSWDRVDTDDWPLLVGRGSAPRTGGGSVRTASSDPVNVYVGKYKNAEAPPTTGGISAQSGADTLTILSATVPSQAPGIGGERFEVNIVATAGWNEISLGLEFCLAGQCISLASVGVEKNDDDSLCVDTKTSSWPIGIEGCIIYRWDGGDSLELGGEIGVCAPEPNPCGWIDCQVCISEGISGSLPSPV